jgi:hypothetical protein
MDVFEKSLDTITNSKLSKKTIMENLQQLVLLIDEMFDEGILINDSLIDLENKIMMQDVKSTSQSNNSTSSASSFIGSVRNKFNDQIWGTAKGMFYK